MSSSRIGEQAKRTDKVYLVVRHTPSQHYYSIKNVRIYSTLAGVRSFLQTAKPEDFEVFVSSVEWQRVELTDI